MKTRFKKLTALLLSVLMLMTALPLADADFSITASAESAFAPSGQCGDDVSWDFNSETGVLTISGTGSMYDYDWDESPFYESEEILQIVIESGIDYIGSYAFSSCMELKTVRINTMSASVGACAFDLCLDLTDVYFIGDNSEWDDFCANVDYGNYDLLNKSVHCLGDLTENFYGPLSYDISGGKADIIYCDMSYSGVLDIPAEIDGCPVVKLAANSISYCQHITEINVPASVETVGSRAFSECEKLKSVSFAEGVKAIEDNAFENCHSLETVSFPSTLTTLGDSAFKNCSALNNISVGSDSESFLTDRKGVLYTKDYSELIRYPTGKADTEYTVSANTKAIRAYAFASSQNLTKVTSNGILETIGKYAFHNCYKLESVKVPDSVNEIGEYAFDHTALSAIVAPKGITEIRDGTYSYCTKLKTVEVPDGITVCDKAFSNIETDEFIIGADVLDSNDFSGFKTAKFTVDENNPYFTADEKGVLYNKDKATLIRFPVLSDITVYEIPDSVTVIGKYAFSTTDALNVLSVPVSVVQIKDFAFYYSKISFIGYEGSQSKWAEIEISKNAFLGSEDIPEYSEYGKESGTCGENLTWTYDKFTNGLLIEGSGEMESNAAFTDYGWYSFKDKIEYVELADGVTSIGTNAFDGCAKLGEVYLSKDVVSVGENAFRDCKSLSLATVNASSFTAENAFSANSSDLAIIAENTNTAAADFARAINARLITVSYSEQDENKILSFDGGTTVYQGLSYNYLTKFITQYPQTDYVHFDRLVFDGEDAEALEILLDEIDFQSSNLTLTNLYVSLRVVRENTESEITFGALLELLESGNYDAFKLIISSDEQSGETTFFEKIADFFIKFGEDALKLISKVVNFVTNLFKKK